MLQHWNDLRCLKRRHIVFSFSDTNPPQKWENWRWGPRNRDLLANGFFCFGISTHLQPKALEFQQIFPILSGCSRKRSHPVFFLPIFVGIPQSHPEVPKVDMMDEWKKPNCVSVRSEPLKPLFGLRKFPTRNLPFFLIWEIFGANF